MFIGRERELASLKEFYEKDRIGMIVIYGRRRIGKSTLITEFVKDKKTIFYTATKVGKHRNLELFSRQVLDVLMPGVENISFNTTEAYPLSKTAFGSVHEPFLQTEYCSTVRFNSLRSLSYP